MADQKITELQAKALYEGAAAADLKRPASENPYKEGALFDELQLAEFWYQGHSYAMRRARGKIGRARRRSAAHYAF